MSAMINDNNIPPATSMTRTINCPSIAATVKCRKNGRLVGNGVMTAHSESGGNSVALEMPALTAAVNNCPPRSKR